MRLLPLVSTIGGTNGQTVALAPAGRNWNVDVEGVAGEARIVRATAIVHYRKAAERTSNLPERNYLLAQAARLSS